MVKEVRAKSILQRTRQPERWFDVRYNYNVYRGCRHNCIYCDSRSECYGIEDFTDVTVKVNGPELLDRQLTGKRGKGTIGTGSMSDPYEPAEGEYRLTRRMLEVIAVHGFPLHMVTKSDMVVRDLDLLQRINETYAQVVFTLTTADDALAGLVEPGAPSPSRRLKAMKALADAGIRVGVLLMPLLPFIEDNAENIRAVVGSSKAAGAGFIIPSFGMTLRDRQRSYYYEQLDRYFPGLSDRYRRTFGQQYSCGSPEHGRLRRLFEELCRKEELVYRMHEVETFEKRQRPMRLFDR